MNIFVKTLIVCAICFHSNSISAQVNEYLNSEKNRISNAQQIEVAIQNFIDANFNNYELSQEVNAELIEHLRSEEEFTDGELQKAILNIITEFSNPTQKPIFTIVSKVYLSLKSLRAPPVF